MKKTWLLVVAVAAVLGAWVLATWLGAVTEASAQTTGVPQVVVMACTGMHDLSVQAAASSNGAPIIAGTANCAQALADLINAGFRIHETHAAGDNGAYYTLLKV